MCEIDVSCLINDVDPFVLSHSIAEAGEANKWSDALDVAKDHGLDISNRKAVKRFFAGFGAWKRDEIAKWTDTELDALVLQYAAGDFRELQSLCPGRGLGGINWKKAEKLAERGTVGGNLFVHDNKLFISLSE